MRLLLVEDDAMIGRAIVRALTGEGYGVDWIENGQEAVAAVTGTSYAAVLLDLSLPGLDGLGVLRHIRKQDARLPVLVLTARVHVDDRVRGLDQGADDYLPKPFDLDELSARVRALLRRRGLSAAQQLRHAGVTLDTVTREVTLQGRPVELSAREQTLLQALMRRPQAIVSREQLVNEVYGWRDDIASNTIEVYVHSLRRKLGAAFIVTVRGLGYRLIQGG